MHKHVLSAIVITLFFNASLSFAQNGDHPGQVTDDSALVAAVESHRNIFYVEAGNLTVSNILPDDTKGLPHQKWQAKLSNGTTITLIYNSDMGVRVPVKVGDKFAVGGQYIQTPGGGLVHWLHDDPHQTRPDGYVYLNGVVYGDTDHEDTRK
jgi:uncharacterized protein DUF3465